MNRLLLIYLCLILACNSEEDRHIPVSEGSIEAFDQQIRAFMAEYDVPAASYAIVVGGRLVLATGYGYADLVETQPTNPDHLFRIASLSKPITAVAALKAAEEGFLQLDQPIAPLLEEGGLLDEDSDPAFHEITVRQLLAHSSGIDRDLFLHTHEISHSLDVENPPNADTIVRYAAQQPLGFQPGTGTVYTNTGYVVLGRVIKQATQIPYEEFVQAFVFEPSGITQAQIGGLTRGDRLENEVEYDSRGERWVSIFENQGRVDAAYGALPINSFDASSGWVMSVVDLARFAASVDGLGGVPDILTEESRAIMSTDQTLLGNNIGAGWFLGTIEVEGQRQRLMDHSGGMPGTTTYVGMREDGFIVAGMLNTWSDDGALFDAFISSFNAAINAVEEWPDRDLFFQF